MVYIHKKNYMMIWYHVSYGGMDTAVLLKPVLSWNFRNRYDLIYHLNLLNLLIYLIEYTNNICTDCARIFNVFPGFFHSNLVLSCHHFQSELCAITLITFNWFKCIMSSIGSSFGGSKYGHSSTYKINKCGTERGRYRYIICSTGGWNKISSAPASGYGTI